MRGTIKHGTQYLADVIQEIGHMYIKKNMTAKEISEETGYSLNTVKRYLSMGGFTRRKY